MSEYIFCEDKFEERFMESPVLLEFGNKAFYCFRDEKQKLFCREKGNHAWEEARLLSEQGEQFCAALDAGFSIHLVLVNNGEFYHLQPGQDKEMQAFYRETDKQCSHLLLAGDGQGLLHLIYLAVDSSADRWWLFHHLFTGNGWQEPRVIDFGGGATYNYGSMSLDQSCTLHLVYRIKDNNMSQLFYRYFPAGDLNWSRALPVSSIGANSFPSILTDREQNLHLAWSSQREGLFQLHYRKKTKGDWPAGGWQEEIVFSAPFNKALFPFLSFAEGQPAISWLSSGRWEQYRLDSKDWFKLNAQYIDQPLLMRFCFQGDERLPLAGWTVGRGSLQSPELFHISPLPQPSDKLEPDFQQLNRYSKSMISQAASLNTAKTRLEQLLEQKKKEMAWFSHQSERRAKALTQDLQDKDRQLQELEQKFNQTVGSLKQKIEQSYKTWDEERKTSQAKIEQLKRESYDLKKMLLEKENTIAKVEARLQEHKQCLQLLQTEKHQLEKQLTKKLFIRKFLDKLLQYKPW